MTSPHRPSTPLRRISRGSIPALRQSQSHIDASGLDDADNGEGSSHHHLLSSIGGAGGALGNLESPLAFMKAAMGDLDHETSILQSNLEAVNSIHAALAVFDENFSMYLYGLKMNAFCVEWAEVGPDGGKLSTGRTDSSANSKAPFWLESPYHTFNPAVLTRANYQHQEKEDSQMPFPHKSHQQALFSHRRPHLDQARNQEQVKQKYASDIIDTLPLEYRGGRDPKPRKIAETVILALIAAGPAGVRTAEIASPPDLPQGKVNMTLLALVQAKHAIRTSSNGVVFSLDPTRHPRLPA
ncbi:DASH complex subunit dam1 [Tilletia horrida]|nr:DASH complex subunit dam1 [Tilletia horrida]